MWKTLAVAGLLWAAATQCVHAQSSIALYGIVDTGIAYTNTAASSISAAGASRVSAVTGFGAGDRFGLTGIEDLGGGTRAVFTLENGFSGLTGAALQGGRMFGRQAFVGLDSERFGRVTLGRQYDISYDYLSPFLAWQTFGSIYGAHIGDVDNTFDTFRLDNTVKYQVSPIEGLRAGAIYAFSNQAGGAPDMGFANNRAYSLGLSWKSNGWQAALTWLHLDNPSSSTSGSNPGGAVGGEYTNATSIFYNTGFVTRQNVYGAAISYATQHAVFNFVFTDTLLDYAGAGSLGVRNYEINTRYYVTPALMLGAGYIFTDGSGFVGTGAKAFARGDHPQWHQLDLGAMYLLSKRTDLHVSVLYQRAAADADTVALNVLGPGGEGRTVQVGVVAGLRHRF
ncbi:porin [Paraburkholderia sp. MMS20-SJTR3]|uniref:Porin n=1 Tax=Paraburkholderia sejongensis TaxID=2886946 RepID=A0ABS8K3M1_9BURK|nr:porin [Paraburkholderia sp. MMS20-SJTR3]MCC8396746.1 porin [Paraburkholderia sp. MMS20-SJTR3]